VKVEQESRAPQVRCHQCGSLSLAALCHHCWRPLCSKHAHAPGRSGQWLTGREGSGSGLGRTRAQHCVMCAAPVTRGPRLTTAALAILAAGGAVALSSIASPAAGGAVAAFTLAVAGIALVAARRQARRTSGDRPMPVRPIVERIALTERLNVTITLDERGRYELVPSEVNGKVEAVLVFGRTDQERFERWLRRRPRKVGRDTRFTAGRLVLTGRAPIAAGEQALAPVIPLDGNTAEFSVFRESDPQSASRWPFELPYKLLDNPELNSGPIWITPSVLPGSDRRSVELELQWVKLASDDRPLDVEMVEFFELLYPVAWGEVEQVSHGAATLGPTDPDSEGRSRMKVRWTQIMPRKKEQEERRLTLIVRFKNKVDLDDHLSGSVEVVMTGALSGIEDIELYGSLGERRQHAGGARIRTRIMARFDLSLAKVRYQAERVFPPYHAKDGEASQLAASFEVVPNDETVIELTNAMSERGFYVKRVIENPPRSGNKADVIQRYWDIAGRHYHGVWPLDFHLILTGEEFHRGDIRPAHGTTKVRIIVRGSYSNTAMKERIERLWTDLNQLTRDTIRNQVPRSSPATTNGSAPGAARRMAAGSPQPARPAPNDLFLQAYLRKLIESWASGRIGDEEFWETRRRAEEDCGLVRDLDEPDSDEEDDGFR
jgi:hypothetical protein